MGNTKIWYSPNSFEAYGEEEIDAVVRSLRKGWLAGTGEDTVEFEKLVSAMFGKKHGLFVNSGSSACMLALASLDLPRDAGVEIVTPACTFATTVAPIVQLGLSPVFVDVVLDTYVPKVEDVLAAVTERTRAIMLPNLIGSMPDWKGLRAGLLAMGRGDVVLIEDSADTVYFNRDDVEGRSDIATTSFYSSHVITTCGSGGMVMFNDERQLKRATMIRDWGRIGNNSENMDVRFDFAVDGIPYDFKFLYGALGYNFKSSEVNASFGIEQLKKLPNILSVRRRNVDRYIERLTPMAKRGWLVLPKDDPSINWLAIPLQCRGKIDRLNLMKHLERNDVQTRVTFSGNITRHPAYRNHLRAFENADLIMRDGFLLGCHQGMSLDDVDRVCDLLREIFEREQSESESECEWGFVLPRFVKSDQHRLVWRLCLESIRRFHPDVPVVFIDDHSDPYYASEAEDRDLMWRDKNVAIVKSAFWPAKGEILPFLYFNDLAKDFASASASLPLPFKKAVLMNDSVFLLKPIGELVDRVVDVAYLWNFGTHEDNGEVCTRILRESKLKHEDDLVELYDKMKWNGCFASCVVIASDYLLHLDRKYGFPTELREHIVDRKCRCELERIVSLVCEHDSKKEPSVLFGSIFNHPNPYSFSLADYLNYIDGFAPNDPVLDAMYACKTWHSR